jgi:hypothetical protein
MRIGPLHSTLRKHSPVQAITEEFGRTVVDEGDLISPVVVRGYQIWRGTAGQGELPLASDFTPERLLSVLPYVYLVDLIGSDVDRDFSYRLIGTDVVSHTEADNTGRRLSDIAGQGSQRTLIRLYELASETSAPAVQRIAYRDRSGRRLWYETIVMPLASVPGGSVSRLLGVAEHFSQSF